MTDISRNNLMETTSSSALSSANTQDTKVVLIKIDYAFKKVMKNKNVLRGLLAAILQIPPEEITDIQYLDVETGKEHEDNKAGILDLCIKMSDNKLINIELQVTHFQFWTNRSLFYLTRKYADQVKSGKDYSSKDILPCINISILDFVLHPEEPSFYNFYQLMNKKTGFVYSDKLSFHTIEIPKLKNASEADKKLPVYRWARFFQAETWEEYEKISKGDSIMETAVNELKHIKDDQIEFLRYLHREIAIMDHNQMMSDAEERGITIGKERGIAIGKQTKLVELIIIKLRKGKSPETIADELEEDIALVTKICAIAKDFAPDYDCEAICSHL